MKLALALIAVNFRSPVFSNTNTGSNSLHAHTKELEPRLRSKSISGTTTPTLTLTGISKRNEQEVEELHAIRQLYLAGLLLIKVFWA